MIVTITQFTALAKDGKGNYMPMGASPVSSEARTTAGAFAAMNSGSKFARVASDTAVKLTDASGNVQYFPANTPEYVGLKGGEVFTLGTV